MRQAAARLASATKCAWSALGRCGRDRNGGVALNLALVAPVLAIAAGAAIDYAHLTDMRRKMQTAADAAALAATREMRLATNDSARAATVARQFVDMHLSAQGVVSYSVVATPVAPGTPPKPPVAGDPSRIAPMSRLVDPSGDTPTSPTSSGSGVDVVISMQATGFFSTLLGQSSTTINVRAEARATSSLPVCLIALDPTAQRALMLAFAAKLEAPGCSVYSDSVDSAGLSVTGFSALRSGFNCSSGGREGMGLNFEPQPQLDCPQIPDPLAARPPPPNPGCTENDMVIAAGVRTLMPGTYCGGLKITSTANVTFSPGEYIIKDGALEISGAAVARGSYVGFHLVGGASVIKFSDSATVELSAPKAGAMAGILFFEDRAAPLGRTHEVASDNVRVLLGTIYLSRGMLRVTARNRVGDMSSYTVVVARRVHIVGTPALFLNTAYSATDVPVPEGLGPNTGAPRLVR